MTGTTAALAFALAASAACAPPPALAAPPVDAPAAARLAAYEQLQPVDEHVFHDKYGSARVLELADGTRVVSPDQLAAVAAPDSRTADAIARYDHAVARTEHRVRQIGLVFAGAAVAGGVEALAIHDSDARLDVIVGTGLVAVAAAIVLCALAPADTREPTRAAFAHYDADLRARLRICADGLRLVACP